MSSAGQFKRLSNDLLIEKELLTVIASLRLKIERREAAFSLLQQDEEAPFEQVVAYFIDGQRSREEARKIWKVLLDYRKEMTKTYGDRVSLHIAVYHLSRDPQTLAEQNLPEDLSATKLAQTLAIQEMKAWWERCSETGVHLREVMEEQLERLVYQGLKRQFPLCLVIVRIRHAERLMLSKEEMGQFARFLMDSCRCRDIVGQYIDDQFALIFPQTPRPGARIALERLHKFFKQKFSNKDFFFDAAIASCPDNGHKGKDLFLIAGDHLKHYGKGKKDQIIECEGEPRALYKFWVFHLRRPIYKFTHSPLQIASVTLLLACGIFAFQKLNFNQPLIWQECFKQELNAAKTLPRWNWGRAEGEAFKLDAKDGFIQSDGSLVCESSERLWYQFPFEAQGEVRLEFQFRLALGGAFCLRLAERPWDEDVVLQFEPGWCKLISNGIVLEIVPLTLEYGLSHKVSLTLASEGVRITLDELPLLEKGRWGKVSPWPSKGYLTCEKGYVWVSDLRILSHGPVQKFNPVPDEWAVMMESLPVGDPSPWAEKMLKAPARLEMVLRANLQRQLRFIASDNALTQRKKILETWGEVILGGDELWAKWLHNTKVSQLKDQWGEALIQRSNTLREIQRAIESPTPLSILQDYSKRELWGNNKYLFLQVVLALDWEKHRLDVAPWAWIELVGLLDELSEMDAMHICLNFLQSELTPEDPIWTSRVCEKLILCGINNVIDVYRAIVAQPLALETVASWPKNTTNSLIMLLQAYAMPAGEARTISLETLSPWMNNSDIGKLLRLDWMWLMLQDQSAASRKNQYLLETLQSQSRRPELARQAILLGGEKLE